MEYLYGKIIYIPRKYYDPKGNKRLGEAIVLDGPKLGEIVKFDILDPPPSVAVTRESLVRMRGYFRDDGVFVIPDREDIVPKMPPNGLLVLIKHELPVVDAEGLIKACGVNKFNDVCELCYSNPEKFAELAEEILSGEHLVKFMEIVKKHLSKFDFDILREILTGAEPGIDLHDVFNVYDLLKHRAEDHETTVSAMVRKEPWLIAQAEGITFKQAEEVARHFGLTGLSPGRVAGALMNILWSAARDGDTYLPYNATLSRLYAMFKNKNTEGIRKIVSSIIHRKDDKKIPPRGKTVPDTRFAAVEISRDYLERTGGFGDPEKEERASKKGEAIYLCGPFFAEQGAARKLVEISSFALSRINDNWLLKAALQEYPRLDDDQKEAVRSVAKYPITLLTGPAGTGKTETIAAAAKAMTSLGKTVRIVAPTAVAAKRISERTGMPASTIHLAVEFTRDEGDHAYPGGSRSFGVFDEDLVIVDEIGMANIVVFRKLLENIKEGGRLLLAGDPSQLNSPGPGDVLKELVRLAVDQKLSGLNYIDLKTIHRHSVIVDSAGMIRQGITPPFRPGFQMLAADGDQLDVLDKLLDDLEADGASYSEIMVLCPKRGDTRSRPGVELINRRLQQRYNPSGKAIESTGFRVGDKVMCVENDYQDEEDEMRSRGRRSVFNGEVGVITGCEKGKATVDYGDGDQPYKLTELTRWLQLAYCTTIHKSQGAESPVVVIISWGEKRFTRSMLYTAVTRAKSNGKHYSGVVYFIGPEGFVANAVARQDEQRYTKLYYRVLREIGEKVSGTPKKKFSVGGISVLAELPPPMSAKDY